ncbi:hypothetical protein MYFR107205_28635 [Mycolicibacterium frederiksbergense]|uniref:hypothetical protein n=1 Tax=Mycolicibacterium frederiksbergense TaxID=117567 RepID=UPI0039F0DAD9
MTKTPPITSTEPVAPPSVSPLAADLDAGLRRLKLAAVPRTAQVRAKYIGVQLVQGL